MREDIKPNETAKQGLRFAGVGIAATLVDFCVYTGLLFGGLVTAPSKFLAAIAGIAASYIGNRFFTFKAAEPRSGTVLAFLALYGVTLSANVAVNEAVLAILPDSFALRIPVAFTCATVLSALLNFAGLKYFVFRPKGA